MVKEALGATETFLDRFPNLMGLVRSVGAPTIILGGLIYWLAVVAYPDFVQAQRAETDRLTALFERMESRHQQEREAMAAAIRTALESGLREQATALRELTREMRDDRFYYRNPTSKGSAL